MDLWKEDGTFQLQTVTNGGEVRTKPVNTKKFFFEINVRRNDNKFVQLPVIRFDNNTCCTCKPPPENCTTCTKTFAEEGDSGSPLFLVREDTATSYFLGNICGKKGATRWDVGMHLLAPQIFKHLLENIVNESNVEKDHRKVAVKALSQLNTKYFTKDSKVNTFNWTLDVTLNKGDRVLPLEVRFKISPCLKGCNANDLSETP